MNSNAVRLGVWLVAILCALQGLLTIYYGFTTIYAYSGFTSIFVGVAIMLIVVGLIKKHHIARIGAYIIFMIPAFYFFIFVLFIESQPNKDGDVNDFGVLEYACVIYIFLAIVAIIFLSLKTTREYFSKRSI
jgi:hypothetical protein